MRTPAGAQFHVNRPSHYHLTVYMSSQPHTLRPDPFNPAAGGLPLDAPPREQAEAARVGGCAAGVWVAHGGGSLSTFACLSLTPLPPPFAALALQPDPATLEREVAAFRAAAADTPAPDFEVKGGSAGGDAAACVQGQAGRLCSSCAGQTNNLPLPPFYRAHRCTGWCSLTPAPCCSARSTAPATWRRCAASCGPRSQEGRPSRARLRCEDGEGG